MPGARGELRSDERKFKYRYLHTSILLYPFWLKCNVFLFWLLLLPILLWLNGCHPLRHREDMFFNLWLRFGYLFFLSLNDGVVAILDLINFQPSVPQWDCRCYCCCFPPLPIIRAMIAVLGYIP